MKIDSQLLMGNSTSHLRDFGQDYIGIRREHKLHHEVMSDFLALKERAKKAGFEMAIVSSFRSYEAQAQIWNAKVRGERQVLDENERPIDIFALGDFDKILAIMRWSALPGASRHHWGTDIDVVDYNAIKGSNYQVQLTQSEASDEGLFGPFHCWLDDQIQSGDSSFFYRPYEHDLGGVSPERWHLSHARTSRALEEAYDLEFFKSTLLKAKFELSQVALDHAREIYERFVSATTPAPWG